MDSIEGHRIKNTEWVSLLSCSLDLGVGDESIDELSDIDLLTQVSEFIYLFL